jgi:hypothetical protein
MRHLDNTIIDALRNHQFHLPLLWAKVTTLPIEVVGGHVGDDLEEEGVTVGAEVEGVGAKVEARVRFLLLSFCLCGCGGCDALPISSSKCVSIGSGTSSSCNTSTFYSNHSGASSMTTLSVSTLHGLLSISSNEMAYVSRTLSIWFTHSMRL